MNSIILRISTLIAYVVMVFTNYLAVSLPLADRDTGAISDSYANLFAPAGYAFSIWGVIYTLLAVYVFFQFSQKKDKLLATINKIFIINAFLNAGWIFAWHYDFIWLSLLIMIALLITLIKIADIFRTNKLNTKQRWLAHLPFNVYFGWITVATIANATIFLVSLGWNGFGLPEAFWTVIVLLVGALIGSMRLLKDRFFPYGLVLIWAYGAILAKHLSTNGFAGQYPSVIATVSICLLVFVAVTGWVTVKNER